MQNFAIFSSEGGMSDRVKRFAEIERIDDHMWIGYVRRSSPMVCKIEMSAAVIIIDHLA